MRAMRAMQAASVVLSIALAGDAWAQAGPPRVTPLLPGDTKTAPDTRDALALEPLRLELLGGFVPHRLSMPGCTDHLEASGTATGAPAFPLMTASTLSLPVFGRRSSWRTPRLTLFGMSRGGCAIDAAAGAGAVVSIPITKTTFFAWGIGQVLLPHGAPGGTGPVQATSVRGDVVFQRPSGRSFSVGASVVNGAPRLSFGGSF